MATVDVVKDFGAVGDGAADDTSAIQAAVDTKDRVYFPRGDYLITDTIVVTASGQVLFGDGVGASNIVIGPSTLDGLEFRTTQYSGLEDIRITHSGTARGGFAVTFMRDPSKNIGCFQSILDRVSLERVYNGVRVRTSTSCTLRRLDIREPRGTYGVLFEGVGDGNDGSYRLVIDDMVGQSQGTRCNWIVQENYAYSLVIDKADLAGGSRGFLMADAAKAGKSYPLWAFIYNLACDDPDFACVHLRRGEGVYLTSSALTHCKRGNGVRVESVFRGEVSFNGGTTISGNAKNGIWVQPGPVDIRFTDLMISENSQLSGDTYSGIRMDGGCRDFQITNCVVGDKVAGQLPQKYGVFILSGCSNYIVAKNNLRGNGQQGLRDLGSGDKQTSLNLE